MSEAQQPETTTTQTAAELNMITEFLRKTAAQAQARVHTIEENAGRYLNELVDKGRQARDSQRKRLEGLLETLRRPELLDRAVTVLRSSELQEKLRTPEIARHFAELRTELLDLFGLATREQVEALKAELDALRAQAPAAPAAEGEEKEELEAGAEGKKTAKRAKKAPRQDKHEGAEEPAVAEPDTEHRD